MAARFFQHQLPDSIKKSLVKILHSETLAHLFVFTSPSIQTATCVAKDFALEWLGSTAMFHPDLLEVKTTGKLGLHSIIGIRSVLDQLSVTPHTAKGRAVLIEAADKMLPQAANALLKALEEPPPCTLIILTTCSPYRILPTILSRSQIIRIPSTVALENQTVQPLLEYMLSPNPAYSALKGMCEDIQKKIEADLFVAARKNMEHLSKVYGDLTPAAKLEFQQEIEAASSMAFQTAAKEILESVYLSIRSQHGEIAVSLLLEALRGIDAGAEFAQTLLGFVTSLSYTRIV